jgi:hypothetical protein
LVKDEKGDLLGDSHEILKRQKSYFSQLLSVLEVIDVRQMKIQIPEPNPLQCGKV